MAGIERALERGGGIDVVLGEHVVARHQIARGGVRITVAEGQVLGVLQHVVDRIDRAVLARDQHTPVTGSATGRGGLGEDFTVGTVHGFDGGLVAQPGDVDLVEAHALDQAGIVGGKRGVDLQAGLLVHVIQERLPDALEVLRRLGGHDAEVDGFFFSLGGAHQTTGEQCCTSKNATDTVQHGKVS
ncbi:hypothetical protein D3C80_1402760 [compost metagenome]